MAVHIASTVTKTLERWRTTQCTACSTDFAYLQSISASGTRYFEKDASDLANQKLAARVESDLRLGPACPHTATACPSCGSYNKDMLKEALYKRANLITIRVGVALALLWAVLVVTAIGMFLSDPHDVHPISDMMLTILFRYYIPASLVFLLVLYIVLRKQDLNTPGRKRKRAQKRKDDVLLRSEFDEMTSEMSDEEQEYELLLARWPS